MHVPPVPYPCATYAAFTTLPPVPFYLCRFATVPALVPPQAYKAVIELCSRSHESRYRPLAYHIYIVVLAGLVTAASILSYTLTMLVRYAITREQLVNDLVCLSAQ